MERIFRKLENLLMDYDKMVVKAHDAEGQVCTQNEKILEESTKEESKEIKNKSRNGKSPGKEGINIELMDHWGRNENTLEITKGDNGDYKNDN